MLRHTDPGYLPDLWLCAAPAPTMMCCFTLEAVPRQTLNPVPCHYYHAFACHGALPERVLLRPAQQHGSWHSGLGFSPYACCSPIPQACVVGGQAFGKRPCVCTSLPNHSPCPHTFLCGLGLD